MLRVLRALLLLAAAGHTPATASHHEVIGRSVQGRALVAVRNGPAAAPRRVLVVGCIHGDERAGIAIVRDLQRAGPPPGVAVWTVADLNPDGAHAGTRQNARRVDLNRNFPWRWQPLGHAGDQQYSGPRPLSEPESRAARALILRVRPQVTIWFHQPLGLVDESGGDVAIERRFARLAGLPLRRLVRYPGSAAGWQDHALPRTTAFVVGFPAGRIGAARAARYARAVLTLAHGI